MGMTRHRTKEISGALAATCNNFFVDSPKVKIRLTGRFGKGVFAKSDIRKGEVVAKFDGRFYTYDHEPWSDDLYNHAIQFDKKKWRDSKGLARWINHSCSPNCGIRDLFKVVAMRAIRKGEEITWDYEMTEKNPYWRMKCRCGSKDCRRSIGNFRRMPRNVRRRYKGFISEWLLREEIK